MGRSTEALGRSLGRKWPKLAAKCWVTPNSRVGAGNALTESMPLKKVVMGLLDSTERAASVVRDLQSAGFGTADISVIFPDTRVAHDHDVDPTTKTAEGGAAGIRAGGTLGGTLGLLAGIGALSIPGLGPLVAAGPLLGAFMGATAGAAVGGLAGALVGLGIPEHEATAVEGKIGEGDVLLSVHVESMAEQSRARSVLARHGARAMPMTVETPMLFAPGHRSL